METNPQKSSTENFVKDIRNKTRRIFTSDQKILIVIEAIGGESPVAEICRKYGILQAQSYRWNKEFLEAGKKRLAGDTQREVRSDEVAALRKENLQPKEMLANLMTKTITKRLHLLLKTRSLKWK